MTDEERGRAWWHVTPQGEFQARVGALLRERDEALASADNLGIEMQGWKARAEKAEAELAALRKAANEACDTGTWSGLFDAMAALRGKDARE